MKQLYRGTTLINDVFIGSTRVDVERRVIPIISDDLELYLDAGSSLSYPGSGDTWFDLSNNNRDVTLINNPTYETASIIDNGSFNFNGTTQYATAYDVPGTIFTGPWTITIWARADVVLDRFLISQGQIGTAISKPVVMFLASKGFPNNGYYVGYGQFDHPSVANATAGQYFQLTGIHDGVSNDTSIYVNGLPDRLNVSNISPVWTDSNLEIGRYGVTGATPSGYFDGRIAEVYIYSRVLSSGEILYNYNARKSFYGL
jgi:hypothetical protein